MKKWVLIIIALVFTLSLGMISDSYAGEVTLNLKRVGSLINVDDAAGRWQHEGGQVLKANKQVGNFSIYRRVTTAGTSPQNTAMLTMTIFFLGQAPPQNITLQGSHDFSSGGYIGSVSAASNRYTWIQGADFTGSTATNSLTIHWNGSSSLTIP
jgi:hypothetical protein